MQVDSVTLGWKALGKVVTKITDAVNANEPLAGEGIRITETSTGKLIETAPAGQGGVGGAGGGGGGTLPGSSSPSPCSTKATFINSMSGRRVNCTTRCR